MRCEHVGHVAGSLKLSEDGMFRPLVHDSSNIIFSPVGKQLQHAGYAQLRHALSMMIERITLLRDFWVIFSTA